jgi:FtsH-binding integral membrane protein
MSPKTYLRILQGGIALSLLAILFVFKELLFPYITSKQLPFNIIMEFLFVIWLVFIMRYPKYRPKKNLITYGLIAYFLAILASCVVSVDFNLSFWGDAERMLGFFHLAHFLVFYLVIITAFRNWKDWQNSGFLSPLLFW